MGMKGVLRCLRRWERYDLAPMLRGGVLFSQSEQMSLNGLDMFPSPRDFLPSVGVLVHARASLQRRQ